MKNRLGWAVQFHLLSCARPRSPQVQEDALADGSGRVDVYGEDLNELEVPFVAETQSPPRLFRSHHDMGKQSSSKKNMGKQRTDSRSIRGDAGCRGGESGLKSTNVNAQRLTNRGREEDRGEAQRARS